MTGLLICLAALCLSCSFAEETSHQFDFLYFTQVWPQTACIKWKDKSANHTCNLDHGSDWSVHGVWPTKDNKIGPLFCDNSTKFHPEDIQDLLPELEAHWIDVYGGPHNKYSFWKHEYLKHGTCAENVTELDSEHSYFKKGLQLRSQYGISSLLKKGGLYEGSSYNADAFITAVTTSLGGYKPALECLKDEDGYYMYQIGICMSKEFKLMSCDKVAGGVYGNCPKETNSLIKYPYGPGSSGASFGVVFVIILCLVIFAGLAYFLYTKYINHRRLAEYNRL